MLRGNVKLWASRILVARYTVPIVIFMLFLVLNLGSTGPAYMSDEIGYLTKATTLAGSSVQLATSWFAGYSYLLAPAYFLSSDPFVSWKIILVLNALMWAGTAVLLRYILQVTHKEITARTLNLVTLGAMLYPSWISMSGYAFATSGFVLVFMASLAALLKSGLNNWSWLAISSILAALLGWMHPLGFVYIGLLAILICINAVLRRKWQLTLAAGLGLAVAASYPLFVHSQFIRVMQGSATNDSHYNDSAASIFQSLGTAEYWLHAGLLVLGLVFSVIISTFGLIVFVAASSLSWLKTGGLSSALKDTRLIIVLLPILSIIGVIGITAASWGASEYIRLDQWVYGRYSDMYILPVLGFGLLAAWRLRTALVAAGFVLIVGVLLTLATNPENTAFGFNNKVNIQSLWPAHVASVLHLNYYWLWGLIGAVGIAVVGLFGVPKRKPLLALLVVPVVLCGISNQLYHRTIVKQYSTPSSLYGYLKQQPRSNCIGFTTEHDSQERFNLYAYYLHGYDMRKMPTEQWKAEQCSGPYLSYNANLNSASDLRLVGIEPKTGLYVYSRTATVSQPLLFK